jgi:hypothetical protein
MIRKVALETRSIYRSPHRNIVLDLSSARRNFENQLSVNALGFSDPAQMNHVDPEALSVSIRSEHGIIIALQQRLWAKNVAP